MGSSGFLLPDSYGPILTVILFGNCCDHPLSFSTPVIRAVTCVHLSFPIYINVTSFALIFQGKILLLSILDAIYPPFEHLYGVKEFFCHHEKLLCKGLSAVTVQFPNSFQFLCPICSVRHIYY